MVATPRLALLMMAALCLAPGQTVRVRFHDGLRSVPMETYVEWVLAGEAGAVSSPEALKAMAVTARTYARANLGRHSAAGYDFCESTHCQDARRTTVTSQIQRAVEETKGVILWYQGRPAEVFYSRNCGGRTASAGEVWPGAARPYLPSQEDPFCASPGARRWSSLVAWQDLARALGLRGIRHAEVLRRTASGRAATLRTDAGLVGAERLHLAAGRALGWSVIPSRLYDVESAPSGAIFRGIGSGHGVGLCQNGAEQRSIYGKNYTDIVAFYFPGTRPGVSARDIRWRVCRGDFVDLYTAGGGARSPLLGLADRLWPEALRRSGLDCPSRPQLRVYPSVAVFRDATGESGALAAVTRGRIIHLQPVARLGKLLPSILLHEMMHVLIGSNRRASLPSWFEEGLAECLAGGEIRIEERRQVEALIARQGRAAVLRMLQTGLPQ